MVIFTIYQVEDGYQVDGDGDVYATFDAARWAIEYHCEMEGIQTYRIDAE